MPHLQESGEEWRQRFAQSKQPKELGDLRGNASLKIELKLWTWFRQDWTNQLGPGPLIFILGHSRPRVLVLSHIGYLLVPRRIYYLTV